MGLTQLVITPSYPPVDSSVTMINIKIIEALERLGVRTVVLTVTPEDVDYTVTPQLEQIFRSGRKVYRVKTYERNGKLLSWLRLAAIRTPLHYAPDGHYIWDVMAIKTLWRIFQENRINIIHSISSPYCSHIVGYFAKKISGKPWICHLDDFWADQPAEHFGMYRWINRWLQGRCFTHADAILSTSREILDAADKWIPARVRKKYAYIPPSYSRSHYPTKYRMDTGKYTFAYLGVFYPGKREPYTLFGALRLIKQSHPALFDKMAIRIIGPDPQKWVSEAKKYGVDHAVEFISRVDYLNALRHMKESAVLLNISMSARWRITEDIYVPGKLFEYFGANRLIVSMTTKNSPVAKFTERLGGISCDYDDPEDIARTLMGIMRKHTIMSLYRWNYREPLYRSYESDNVSRLYLSLIQKLAA